MDRTAILNRLQTNTKGILQLLQPNIIVFLAPVSTWVVDVAEASLAVRKKSHYLLGSIKFIVESMQR